MSEDKNLRVYYLDKHHRRLAQEAEQRHKRLMDKLERQHQHAHTERIKCPRCHQYIAEKFICSVFDVPLFSRGRSGCSCMCRRAGLPSQMRRFLLRCWCWNTPTTIPCIQFPNELIVSGIRLPVEQDYDGAMCQLFESMEDLDHSLRNQSIVHDWSIEWIDGEVEV